MAQTQLTDVIIPDEFTAYQVDNSLVSTALSQSGVVANNAVIASQLQAGAESFNVPFWNDMSDVEAVIANDDPTILSTTQKISAVSRPFANLFFMRHSPRWVCVGTFR